EWRKPPFQLRILRDTLRMQLQLHPLLEPQLADCVRISRPLPESQTIKRMIDTKILRELALKRSVGLRLLRPQTSAQDKRDEEPLCHSFILLLFLQPMQSSSAFAIPISCRLSKNDLQTDSSRTPMC